MIALDDDMNVNEEDDEFESRLIQIRRELKQTQNRLTKLIKKNNKRSLEESSEMRKSIVTVEAKIDQITNNQNDQFKKLQSMVRKSIKQ